MGTMNGSFDPSMGNVQHAAISLQQGAGDIIFQRTGGANTWAIILTLFLALVLYDQC